MKPNATRVIAVINAKDEKVKKLFYNIPWLCAHNVMVTHPVNGIFG